MYNLQYNETGRYSPEIGVIWSKITEIGKQMCGRPHPIRLTKISKFQFHEICHLDNSTLTKFGVIWMKNGKVIAVFVKYLQVVQCVLEATCWNLS